MPRRISGHVMTKVRMGNPSHLSGSHFRKELEISKAEKQSYFKSREASKYDRRSTSNDKKAHLRRLTDLFTSSKVRPVDEESTIKTFFESLDTPLALSCWLLYKSGEHIQLAAKRVDPQHYLNAHSFKLDFNAISFLRKAKFLKTGLDLREAALRSFRLGEEENARTNGRFADLALDPLFKGPNVWLLNAISRKIANILGKYHPEDLFTNGAWGPGSTLMINGVDTSPSRKFESERQITDKLYRLVAESLPSQYPAWFASAREVYDLQLTNSSNLLTVPKDAETDRTIFVEPGLNTWFQKSCGKSIRRCLRRAGYDLDSSSRNETIAKQSSVDGCAATVDFKNASNTISYNLIRELLPLDWFFVLNCCRTPCYKVDGDNHSFQMFSSMGNGFTFELESLVFVAAAEAVHDYLGLPYDSISVFGDDITLDASAYDLYAEFTSFLGFTVNKAKSYASGPFRESCGTYYFQGTDVKPYFQKERISNAKSIFRLVNGISRLSHRNLNGYGRDRRYFPLYRHLLTILPSSLAAIRGTVDHGDGCIHSNLDECNPSAPLDGWEGFLTPVFIEKPVTGTRSGRSMLLTRLWYPSAERAHANDFELRSVTQTRLKSVFVPQWYEFGPWVDPKFPT